MSDALLPPRTLAAEVARQARDLVTLAETLIQRVEQAETNQDDLGKAQQAAEAADEVMRVAMEVEVLSFRVRERLTR